MEGGNFVDYVKIFCRSGNGGAGSVHFRREKYVPQGGPDGGNGGKGGDVVLVGNQQLWTLLHLKWKRHLFAEDGKNGRKQNMSGVSGKDIVVEVPLGTVIKDGETNEIIGEILEHDERFVLMHGGRGGLGNDHFKNSTNQSPHYAQPGEEGETGSRILELKVLADVGLVGFPNAGKSTLLSVVTAAKPKIANYPFTTLVPNLGIVSYYDNKSFVMADIPGIIEGAHQGKGLGGRFLRHIERNAALLFLVPSDAEDIKKEYDILLNELGEFNPELLDKKRILGISKSDLLDEELKLMLKEDLPTELPIIYFSSMTGEGIPELKDLIWKSLVEE